MVFVEDEGAGVEDEGCDEDGDVTGKFGTTSWWSVYESSVHEKVGCDVYLECEVFHVADGVVQVGGASDGVLERGGDSTSRLVLTVLDGNLVVGRGGCSNLMKGLGKFDHITLTLK